MAGRLGVWVLAVLLAAAAGCGGGEGVPNGRLSLYVTDAPVDEAARVSVAFAAVTLRSEDGGEARWELGAVPMEVDLLELRSGERKALLLDEEVPPGRYEGVRFEFAEGSFVEVDGARLPLEVGEEEAGVLQVAQPVVVPPGGQASYTVEFGLREALRAAASGGRARREGGGGSYRLVPRLRLVDDRAAGSLAGALVDVDPGTCPSPAVYLFEGRDASPGDLGSDDPRRPAPTATADVVLDEPFHVYRFGFLAPGEYTVALTCHARDDAPETADPLPFQKSSTVRVEPRSETWIDF
ncbi:MAG: DUF4382 domain-containing protein [Deferrisomatales bacterium]